MTRSLFVAAAVFGFDAPAVAQAPKLGTPTQVEFTGREPKMGGVPGLDYSAYRVKVFEYPVEPGDRFRVEMESVGGVELELIAFAFKESPNGYVHHATSPEESKGKLDWALPKAPPGKKVQLIVGCTDVGKVNLRITKVGTPTGGDPNPSDIAAELKKLREELEALRKENAELRKQIADLKKRP